MFERKTVFVIGAGASVDLNLPAGPGLKSDIARQVELNPQNAYHSFINEQMQYAVQSECQSMDGNNFHEHFRNFRLAAGMISRGMPSAPSIDNYLHTHRANNYIVRLGKLAIANAILEGESRSQLIAKNNTFGIPQELQFSLPIAAHGLWHMRLVNRLISQISVDEIERAFENVTFIVFNYDRCLEQYLRLAFEDHFAPNMTGVAEAFKNLDVIHPYGQVGKLPWQSNTTGIGIGRNEGQILNGIADDILTFTESERSGRAKDMKEAIANAHTVVFLGFSFLDQNLELLTPNYHSSVQRVFFTSHGISDSDTEIVVRNLKSVFENNSPPPITIKPSFEARTTKGKCEHLFDEFWLRLVS